jgi:hypothetical protein
MGIAEASVERQRGMTNRRSDGPEE